MDTMRVAFAINDDNGNWDYEIRRVDFGDMLTLDAAYTPVQADYDPAALYIGTLRIPYTGQTSWAGSMMFEAFMISIQDANALAEYLRKRDYVTDSGITTVYDAYNDGHPIDFAAALAESED